jgi:hypothetical protein
LLAERIPARNRAMRTGSIALLSAVALVAGCESEKPKSDLTPLVGVGGNPYCVSDFDEQKLSGEARYNLMSAWILIHHYQYCELNRDKAGTLMQLQISKDEEEVLAALAEFNARIEAGRRLNAAPVGGEAKR